MSIIHPTAVIADGAELGEGVEIGPYCVIGPNVSIGAGSSLQSHVVVDGHTAIGADCRVFPFASLGTQTQDLKYKGGTTYVQIGDGTTLREYVTVNSGTEDGEATRVGSNCTLLAYSHVAHGCRVGNGVIMSNGVQLAGHVVVEDFVIIGGLSGVHQFVRVGTMCMIGGCTKIGQDLPPYLLADGNPAGVHGINSIGLKRRGLSDAVVATLKKAYKIVYRDGLVLNEAIKVLGTDLEKCAELDCFTEFLSKTERGILR